MVRWPRSESRREMLNDVPVRPDTVLALSDDERRWDAVLDTWREARRLERLVRRAVRRHGLSVGHYQVLAAADHRIRLCSDACSQQDIVQRTGFCKGSVSRYIHSLSEKGLVDVMPDAWFLFDRIWITDHGAELLALVRGKVAAAIREDPFAT